MQLPGVQNAAPSSASQTARSAAKQSDLFAKMLTEVTEEARQIPPAKQPQGSLEAERPLSSLTEQELADLSARLNPACTNQEEYDAFLEELLALGVIGRSDLGPLGYMGARLAGYVDENGAFQSVISDKGVVVPMFDKGDAFNADPFQAFDLHGDLLTWVRAIANSYYAEEGEVRYPTEMATLFGELLLVLENLMSLQPAAEAD